MAVRWAPEARVALDDIRVSLAELSDTLADQWIIRIVARAETLTRFPRRGHFLDEAGEDELRQIWEGQFRIVYLVAGEQVEVVTVLHGARLLEL